MSPFCGLLLQPVTGGEEIPHTRWCGSCLSCKEVRGARLMEEQRSAEAGTGASRNAADLSALGLLSAASVIHKEKELVCSSSLCGPPSRWLNERTSHTTGKGRQERWLRLRAAAVSS